MVAVQTGMMTCGVANVRAVPSSSSALAQCSLQPAAAGLEHDPASGTTCYDTFIVLRAPCNTAGAQQWTCH